MLLSKNFGEQIFRQLYGDKTYRILHQKLLERAEIEMYIVVVAMFSQLKMPEL